LALRDARLRFDLQSIAGSIDTHPSDSELIDRQSGQFPFDFVGQTAHRRRAHRLARRRHASRWTPSDRKSKGGHECPPPNRSPPRQPINGTAGDKR
jgi:hypothetical protein